MTAEMFESSPAGTLGIAAKRRSRRGLIRTLVAAGAIAAFVGGMSGVASAAANDSIEVSVAVTSTLDLTIIDTTFSLDGLPGATVALPNAVTYTVTTNNTTGYAVTVQADAATLVGGSTTDGEDTILVGAMTVKQDTAAYQAITSSSAVEVYTQATRSEAGGDQFTNDYSIDIPNVTADTYTVGLDYVVTAS